MAYELLAGRPPFIGATPQQIFAAQVTTLPEPLTALRSAVPLPLAQLVMRCLEKKPADRPQPAEELLPVLDALGTSSGSTATPMALARKRWVPFAVVAGLATAAIAAVWLVARRSTIDTAGGGSAMCSIAVLPFQNPLAAGAATGPPHRAQFPGLTTVARFATSSAPPAHCRL